MSAILTVPALLGRGGRLARVIGAAYEARAAQLTMAEAVRQAVLARTPLVVEAGTGSGKSLAYLAGGLAADARLVVSTSSKALQGQLLNNDLPLLARAVSGLAFAAAKGRANYLCHWKAMARLGQFSTWAWPEDLPPGDMTAWATATAIGDPSTGSGQALNEIPFPAPRAALEKVAAGDDCLGPHCQFYADCWYYRARERWRQADVLVTNHALLLTDLTRPLGLLEGAGDRPLLLVCDEAHQLESYAVAARSADVTRRALRWAEELAPDLATLGDEFTQAVAGQYVEWHSDRVIPAGDAILEGADLVAALRDLASDFWSSSQPPSDPADAERYAHAVRLRNLAQRVKDVSDPTQAGYVRHVAHLPERRGDVTDAIVIANTAWQVADLLAQLPQRAASVVYCSATLATGTGLASLGFFERSVGLGCAGVAPTELIVGSPFDYDRQGLLYLPLPGRLPADPNAPDYALACAREMVALVRLTGGRALCLFTSYTALRQAAEVFGQWVPEITVMQQGEDLSRDAILTCFREAQGRGLAILGTKSFWEGVSLEGEQLTLVAVDRVPFTPPGPVQLAKQADLAARGGQWFRDLALPEAIGVLRQGVGRLIRTTADRGVVTLLDPRLTTKPWGQTILNALPSFRRTSDLAQVAHFLASARSTPLPAYQAPAVLGSRG
jgi:ATP-dependent DNA helicase DinG